MDTPHGYLISSITTNTSYVPFIPALFTLVFVTRSSDYRNVPQHMALWETAVVEI